MKTKVVNLKKEKYDVYIGRKGRGHEGYFGNPFSAREHGRAKCIAMFQEYFYMRMAKDEVFAKRVVSELSGKRLGCFCSPLPCHGDVYAEYLNGHGHHCDLSL